MKRRFTGQFRGSFPIRSGMSALLLTLSFAIGAFGQSSRSPHSAAHDAMSLSQQIGAPLARDPIVVYNDWSAYDELSDNIPLTE
jgi:hypothetical protein